MFQRCFDDNEFKQAVGIALESRRLDVVEKAVQLSGMRHSYVGHGAVTNVC